MNRRGRVERQTRETRICLEVVLDGRGTLQGGVDGAFFDHMLAALAGTARWDLVIESQADLHVEPHHAVEDTGIVLGRAIRDAIADGRGISRFGHAVVPMDDALIEVVCDVSGRTFVEADFQPPAREFGGGYHTELTVEFFWGLARGLGLTVHLRQRSGWNAHHMTECAYKALGLALRRALAPDERGDVPSTKGSLFA